MYKGKKIIAIIPARSGSKGIKDKNIKELCGKPLIYYTINAALKSKIFEDIIVSTDSSKYAEISKEYGAKVPFLRSKKLGMDETPTCDVILEVINNMKKIGKEYDYFILLQPTSPMRTHEDIINATNLIIKSSNKSCISVCKIKNERYLENILPDDLSMSRFLDENMQSMRRQDNREIYKINGAIYISEVEEYIKYKTFYGGKSIAYIMKELNSIDIDNDLEFEFSNFLLAKLNK